MTGFSFLRFFCFLQAIHNVTDTVLPVGDGVSDSNP